MDRADTRNAPGELTPGASKDACNLGTAGPENSSFSQSFQAANRPPASANADQHRDYLCCIASDLLNYADMAARFVEMDDEHGARHAFRMAAKRAVAGSDALKNLELAKQTDQAWRDAARAANKSKTNVVQVGEPGRNNLKNTRGSGHHG